MGMWGRKHKKLAVALTCADWRLHLHKVDMNARLAKLLGVDGVDLIAMPGPDGLIKPERASEWQVAVSQTKLLIVAHEPIVVVVLAHQRCAGHPVADADHDVDATATAKALKAATGFVGPVRAVLAVYQSDISWDLKPLAEF
jgi:Putative carbonic anhydrase